MYSNLLGVNPKTFIQALVQPYVTTLPELSLGGNGWAAAKVLGAQMKTATKLVTDPKGLLEEFAQRGYMAPHITSEVSDAFRTGFQRGATSRAVKGIVDTWSKYSLALLQSAEMANRMHSMHIGESVARDLLQGSKSAETFLQNSMGRGYYRQIQKLVQAGDETGLAKELGDYLVAKTNFHYSPLMMSEMGRYFGKLASSFTTWPSTITADIVADFARHDVSKATYLLTKKYLAPLGALAVLDHWMASNGADPSTSPTARGLIGKGGFTAMAPVKAALDITKRGPISSPYIDAPMKAIAGAAEGDPHRWWTGMQELGKTFVPIAPQVEHLITVTLPRLQGREPEK